MKSKRKGKPDPRRVFYERYIKRQRLILNPPAFLELIECATASAWNAGFMSRDRMKKKPRRP